MTIAESERLFRTVGDLISLVCAMKSGKPYEMAEELLERLVGWESDIYQQLAEKLRRRRARGLRQRRY